MYGLQDLIVSAFRGVVPLLNGQDYISVFTGMMGADAYAAGAARWRLADRVAVNTPWGQPVWQVANAFSAWRQKLSGRRAPSAAIELYVPDVPLFEA